MFWCCASGEESKPTDTAEVVDSPPAAELPAEEAEAPEAEEAKKAPSEKQESEAVAAKPSAEAAPAPEGQVGVKLQGNHGMVVDYWADRLQVVAVEANGGAQVFNDGSKDMKIEQHDFIVKVNDSTKFDEMRKLLKSQQDLVIHFAKPVRQNVTIEKGNSSLGMKLIYQKERSTCMRVTEVNEKGKVAEYNAACASDDLKINSGDFIETVNSIAANAVQLFEALKKEGQIQMTVLRCPPEA